MKEKSDNHCTYSVREFARIMDKEPSTVYDWAHQKKIPVQRASGIRIPKLEADILREVSIVTGEDISVNWKGMQEYFYILRDTFPNVLERKGHGQVIKEISELVKKGKG